MQHLADTYDLKKLLGGIAVAAVAGLLLGGSLRPDLKEGENTGPRTLISGGGARSEVMAMDLGMARYEGRVPDYVVGTDWTQPPPLEAQTVNDQDNAPDYDAPYTEDLGDVVIYSAPEVITPMKVTRTTWRDAPNPQIIYPSNTGGMVYESDLPKAPAPPEGSDPG